MTPIEYANRAKRICAHPSPCVVCIEAAIIRAIAEAIKRAIEQVSNQAWDTYGVCRSCKCRGSESHKPSCLYREVMAAIRSDPTTEVVLKPRTAKESL